MTPQHVLYFPINSSASDYEIGRTWIRDARFIVRNEGQQKVVPFRTGPGALFWHEDTGSAVLTGDVSEQGVRLFGTNKGTKRYDPETGTVVWIANSGGSALALHEETLYLADSRHITALDTAAGETSWSNPDVNAKSITIAGNQMYLSNSDYRGRITAVNRLTGDALWSDGEQTNFILMAGDKVFSGDRVYNRITGEEIKDLRLSNLSAGTAGVGRVYLTGSRGTYAYDADTLERVWESGEKGEALFLSGDTLFVTSTSRGAGTVSLNALTGETQWKNDSARGERLAFWRDMVFVSSGNLYALNRNSGALYWESSYSPEDMIVLGDRLYFSDREDEFWAMEPDYFFKDEPGISLPTRYSDLLTLEVSRSLRFALTQENSTRLVFVIFPEPGEYILETQGDVSTYGYLYEFTKHGGTKTVAEERYASGNFQISYTVSEEQAGQPFLLKVGLRSSRDYGKRFELIVRHQE